MFVLTGCQKRESYTLSADDPFFAYAYEYPEYALMLSKINNQYVLLAMKEVNQVMEVYEVIQMPGISGDVSIRSFQLLDEIPTVSLIIDGDTKYFDTVKRVSLSGNYYALELDPDGSEFVLEVSDGCFGVDFPCPFDSKRDRFIDGAYLGYKILSYYKEYMDEPSKRRTQQNNWFPIGNSKLAVFHVLAQDQNNLYKLTVQIVDDEIVYQSTIVSNNAKTANYISSSHTALVIENNLSYRLLDKDLLTIESGPLEGIFKQTIEYLYQIAIETDTHYHIFMDGLFVESVLKMTNVSYVGAQFQGDVFKYYYIENNQLKFIKITY